MGALGGMLGLNGEAGGTGFGGPQQAVSQQGQANLQSLYQALQQVSSGQGPNPAMAQYNQNIQGLAQKQAGAISSIQGISPALASRMISQQGGAAQQNAAAQGATMQAEQQLGAMGQMGQVATNQQQLANGMQQNINNTNAGLAQTTMQGQQGFIGGIMQGGGAAAGLAAAGANGGEVQCMADGGMSEGPVSQFGQFLRGQQSFSLPITQVAPMQSPAAVSGFDKGLGGHKMGSAKQAPQTPENAGQGPTMENSDAIGSGIPYAQPMTMSGGGMTHDYRSGGNVAAQNQAQKAIKPGNDYANDKIPAVLSEGEVVIPRNVMQSKNPAEGAARFVQAVMAKRGKK